MFKKYFVIILLVAIAARPAYFVGTVVYYETHINEIIEKYCVNKDTPELKCNGKCHLAKQLSTVNNSDLTAAQTTLDISVAFFPVFYQDLKLDTSHLVIANSPLDFIDQNNIYNYTLLSSLYRPPIV